MVLSASLTVSTIWVTPLAVDVKQMPVIVGGVMSGGGWLLTGMTFENSELLVGWNGDEGLPSSSNSEAVEVTNWPTEDNDRARGM